jgi:hypothetical protein
LLLLNANRVVPLRTILGVVEYEVPDREGEGKGELIALITTITDPRQAPAGLLRRRITKDGHTRPGTPS